MLRDASDTFDIVDWLMALCLCCASFIAVSFTYQLGDFAVHLWDWKGQLLQVAGAAAVGLCGATLLAGFVLRSRVERGRQASSPPEELPVVQPAPAQEEATQLFRARSFEQDQTVLMHGAELAELRIAPEPEPEPRDDPSVPDQIDVVMGWVLGGYGLLAGLVSLLFLGIGVAWLVYPGPRADEQLQMASARLAGSVPFLLTTGACWSMWRGFF